MAIVLNGTTGIAVPLGTAAAPGLVNTTSATTGFYNPTSTTLGLSTNGTNAVYIDASQNVGIGTTAPAAKLDLGSGNLNFSSTAQRITGDFSNATDTNKVLFQTSTSNSATVVGIIPNGTATNGQLKVYNNSDPTNAATGVLTAQGSYISLQSSITGTGTYLPMAFFTGGSERMRIDSSGNVGIGTSSPGAKLDVSGSIRSTSGNIIAADGSGFSWGAASTYVGGTSASSLITFNTASTERMRIDANGYVLVGTTTVSYGKMTVKSSADAYTGGGIYLQRQANTNGWIILTATSNDLYMGYNNVDKGYFSNSTGAYTAISDATLKKNIVDISCGLDAVKSLRPVEYLMLEEDDGSQKHLGFLAQEAQTVLPSSVSEMQGGKLGMDKSEIIPVLVKAIQELSAEVEALKATVGA